MDAAASIATKPCSECGEPIRVKAELCPKCGVRQKGAVNKTVLLLLSFLGGGLGLHKFYLSRPWQGVLYILFIWTGIPQLIAFVEFVVYACTSEADLNERYQTSTSSAALVIAACLGAVFVIGILAAIAIPAYSDYKVRARTYSAVGQAEPLRKKVEEWIVKSGKLPASPSDVPGAADLRLPGLGTASLGAGGVISIRFDAIADRRVAGTTLELAPRVAGGRLSWSCLGGDLPPRYRAAPCRGR
jgi:TM2 domain-containing membrane protein YozV